MPPYLFIQDVGVLYSMHRTGHLAYFLGACSGGRADFYKGCFL